MAIKAETSPTYLQDVLRHDVQDLVEREGGLYSGHVPMDLISSKDVPVNQENLDLIGTQLDDEAELKNTNGQIQPIMLGMVEGFEQLEIIDGFHRFKKFEARGHDEIYATIIEVTYEELLDKRIQNTKNHQGLQFARATEWVRESWGLNPYSDRISAMQAFILGRTKNSTGSRLGLEENEVEEIMEWVDEKSALWGVGAIAINSYLKTDETVVKDLVHNSRPAATQAPNPNALPQSTLQRIGRAIPGRDTLQRTVAEVITENRLSGTGISGVLADIKDMPDQDAIEHLQTVDFEAYKENIASENTYRYDESEVLRLGRVRESSRVQPLDQAATLTGIHVDMVLDEGGFDPERLKAARDEIAAIVVRLQVQVDKIDKGLKKKPAKSKKTQSRVMAEMDDRRTIREFNEDLRAFMLDSSRPLEIQTQREFVTAERALNRGRGTQDSLSKLQEKIDNYDKDSD